MSNGISFGQYYPADSLLHRLDPRTKVLMTVLYIVCTFLCRSLLSFAVLTASAIVLVAISRIPIRMILSSLRPILFIIVFTSLINVFMTRGEQLLTPPEWKIKIYAEGIWTAFFMILRISTLIIGTSVFLTYTTTPIALTDALEALLSPLKKIKIPVHDFAMMMTIALRFIPTLSEETRKIMNAQKARGADFTSGSLLRRAKALIPILVPLFVSAFNRAFELAAAMECRCYHGGEGRTRLKVLRFRAVDFVMLVLLVGVGVGLVFLNRNGLGYAMK
ncbi:MAG: energy-coupling factor transporter transmembrane protein EcfT [Ruminococcaceae bacterium]|nr:energy-coupling factor transporter transmembrane protein EcfT [Oscillospiraceae bacterium]